jgi:delta 1-pyrroline-5-carboxylate dehydrogenase
VTSANISRKTHTTRYEQAKMMTVEWPNVSPWSTPLGIFCHNIALFICVGDSVAITVGENPPTHVQPGTTTIAPEVNYHGLPSAID